MDRGIGFAGAGRVAGVAGRSRRLTWRWSAACIARGGEASGIEFGSGSGSGSVPGLECSPAAAGSSTAAASGQVLDTEVGLEAGTAAAIELALVSSSMLGSRLAATIAAVGRV